MSGNSFRGFPDPVLIVGGRVAVIGDTTIDIDPVACKDSNKNWPLITQEKISVDISVNGLNGLDQGSVSSSTDYFLYIIRSREFLNDLPVGFVFSLSGVAPSFPKASNIEKYNLFRQIGTFRINASGKIIQTGIAITLKGIVDTYAELPVTPDDILDIWLVRTGTGIWLINRKPAGLYNWNGSKWIHMSAFPNSFNDANFQIFNNSDNTKLIIFNASLISTGNSRKITMPDFDVNLRDADKGYALTLVNSIQSTSSTSNVFAGNNIFNKDLILNDSVIFVAHSGTVPVGGMAVDLIDITNGSALIGTTTFLDADDNTTKFVDITAYINTISGRILVEAQFRKISGGGTTEVLIALIEVS